jgi:hypothetical protein
MKHSAEKTAKPMKWRNIGLLSSSMNPLSFPSSSHSPRATSPANDITKEKEKQKEKDKQKEVKLQVELLPMEKLLLTIPAKYVTQNRNIPGKLTLTDFRILFHSVT